MSFRREEGQYHRIDIAPFLPFENLKVLSSDEGLKADARYSFGREMSPRSLEYRLTVQITGQSNG